MENRIGTDINQVQIQSLSNIHGQTQVIENIKVNLRAYFNTRSSNGSCGLSFGPVILCGPSGTGKTMVAKAIHTELGNLNLIETNGEAINNKSELFSILVDADENTTVFIDESQGMNSKAQHILLTALSERRLYVPAGMAAMQSRAVFLDTFTTILATTHEYLLQDALRNRMRIYCRFNYYSLADLIQIVRQRANALNWQYKSDEVLRTIAQRAKQTPRLALNTNLQMCWNVTRSHDRDVITIEDVREAFHHLQIDTLGLDKLDRSYLEVLLECGRIPLGVIGSKLSLPSLTLQRVVEPYLFKEDLITKDKSSLRIITEKGRKHMNNNCGHNGQLSG